MTASPKAGDVVAGKYLIEGEIGRGGLGVVMAAQHLVLRQRVALKFLRQEFVSEPQAVGRFLREAQAAALMRGEHAARVTDAGTLESGEAFLAMEYLEGRDLAGVLDQDGPLPLEDAVDYLLQACEAVAEAHALGIVHRDLKPANLFLTRAPDGSPFVKVLDFGLSKLAASESRASLTADHQVLGSPHFMSPEQMRSSRDVDHRSDVWALGAVLFTLISGQYPFEGRFLTEICAAVLGGELRRLRDLRPEAPEALEALVVRCLSTDPAARFDSVASLALALAPFAPQRARPQAERVGLVLEAGRSSAPAAIASPSPSGTPPAARPSPFALAPARSPLLAPVARPSLLAPAARPSPLTPAVSPLFLGPPSSSTPPEPAPSSSPPAAELKAPAHDSAPAVSTNSSSQISSVPALGAQNVRPPWAQTLPSTESIAAVPPQPPAPALSPRVKVGALGALGIALATWVVLRSDGTGAQTVPTAPQRVAVPLSAPADLATPAAAPPMRASSELLAEGPTPAQPAVSTPRGSSAAQGSAQAAVRVPSTALPTPRPPFRAAPSSAASSRRPSGPRSDEDIIKSLPH